MNTWSEGYVAGADYVAHYTSELNPVRCGLLLAHAGIAAPERMECACELGFGLGLSTSIHAAASGTAWWATDFSPSQTLYAREFAAASGARVSLVDDAFAEFCHRSDLPDFDFIGLHGVWSWISDANRALIVDFVRRKLRVGGVVYLSYNTLPGWSQMVPVRQLMRVFIERMLVPGAGTLKHAEAARAFAERLFADNPHMAASYPLALRAVESMKKHGPEYVAHEYLNRDWAPMLFADAAERMDAGKASFACSASPVQQFDRHFLTPAQQQSLAAADDIAFRESTRDFILNRQFRKDYWVKGVRRLTPQARQDALRRQRVVLIAAPETVSRRIAEAVLDAEMPEALAGPVLECLAGHRPQSLAQLEERLAPAGLGFPDIVRAVLLLVGNGSVACAQDEATATAASAAARRLNRAIVERSQDAAEVTVLASPVTGGAVNIPQFQLQMLRARAAGKGTAEAWAQALWAPYRDRGVVMMRDGRTLLTEQENLDYLGELAKAFERTELPVLKALGCID